MGILNRFKFNRVQPPGATRAAALPAGLHAPGAPFAQQPMNVIQVPDLSRKLVTRYGIREKAPAPTLSTEVVPVVLVDDLIGESDLIRPRIRPCTGALELTPAAQNPALGLVNPTGSGVVAHVYYVIIAGTATAGYSLHFTGTPITTTTGTKGFRSGLFAAQSPVCDVKGQANVGSPGGAIECYVRHPANSQAIVPFEAVLDEGQGLQLYALTVLTSTVHCTVIWTEEDKR